MEASLYKKIKHGKILLSNKQDISYFKIGSKLQIKRFTKVRWIALLFHIFRFLLPEVSLNGLHRAFTAAVDVGVGWVVPGEDLGHHPEVHPPLVGRPPPLERGRRDQLFDRSELKRELSFDLDRLIWEPGSSHMPFKGTMSYVQVMERVQLWAN